MKLILKLMAEAWPIWLAAAIFGALSGAANVAMLALVHQALQQPGQTPSEIALWFVVACVGALVTPVASQVFLLYVSQASMSRMRMALCRRILEAPLKQLEEIGHHRMQGALTGDVQMVNMAMAGVPMLCVNIVTLVCGAVYLGILSWPLLIAASIFGILGGGTYWLAARIAGVYIRRGREGQDDLLKHVRSLLSGVKEMKMHEPRRRVFLEKVLEPREAYVRHNQMVGSWIQDAAIVWARLLFMVAVGLLLFVWPRFSAVDSTTLAGFTLAIFFLMSPLERIVGWAPLLVMAIVAMMNIESLGLKLEDTGKEPPPKKPINDWRTIEVSGVTHSYRREGQEGGFLLGPIDFAIQRGEILFIVGGNGSGKTTLLKLLTGLYSPENGHLAVDGEVITDERREDYRQLFTALFDDAVLFEGLWGLEHVDLDAQAKHFLTQLRLDHVVQVKEGTFSSTRLSRGQRKRLALLTAYLEDRSIFVFDEWAADQDPVFKRIFYEQLLPELKQRGRTVIAITHDDRYFGGADRVIKLADGRVATETSFAAEEAAATS